MCAVQLPSSRLNAIGGSKCQILLEGYDMLYDGTVVSAVLTQLAEAAETSGCT